MKKRKLFKISCLLGMILFAGNVCAQEPSQKESLEKAIAVYNKMFSRTTILKEICQESGYTILNYIRWYITTNEEEISGNIQKIEEMTPSEQEQFAASFAALMPQMKQELQDIISSNAEDTLSFCRMLDQNPAEASALYFKD